jgi:hypothetical protein
MRRWHVTLAMIGTRALRIWRFTHAGSGVTQSAPTGSRGANSPKRALGSTGRAMRPRRFHGAGPSALARVRGARNARSTRRAVRPVRTAASRYGARLASRAPSVALTTSSAERTSPSSTTPATRSRRPPASVIVVPVRAWRSRADVRDSSARPAPCFANAARSAFGSIAA